MTLSRPLGHQRRTLIVADIRDAAEALVDTYPRAAELLTDWSGPQVGGGSTGSRASGHSDPTERVASSSAPWTEHLADGTTKHHKGVPVDPAGDMLLCRDRKLVAAREVLYDLMHEAQALLDPKVIEGPECAFCARYGYHRAVLRTAPAPGTEKPGIPRCANHDAFLVRYDEDPSPAVAQFIASHPSAKIPVALIRQEHPQAYEVHHAGVRGAKNPVNIGLSGSKVQA